MNNMRKDILDRKDDILEWIKENKSKAFICSQLKCKPETLKKYLKEMDIVYDGNQSGKGYKKNNNAYLPLDQYLEKSKDIQTNKIRKKILREGIKPHMCERCCNTEWLGEPIPLELHHKDGNPYNNELDNLELLCPNCHAQTDTYRGKNCKKP